MDPAEAPDFHVLRFFMHTIISLGGSLIVPKTGIDIAFLKRFRQLILSEIRRDRPARNATHSVAGGRFVLIVGGGATARAYQGALRVLEIPKQVRDDTLDWMGIYATMINTQLVRLLFGAYAYEKIGINPTRKIKTTKPIIVGAGWKPGCSSDNVAVLAAKTYGAREVINMTNVGYVYDKDPTKYQSAKPIKQITWPAYRAMVGDRWYPGSNAPFDPVAARAAAANQLTVKILNGRDLASVRKAIRGGAFKGTTIA